MDKFYIYDNGSKDNISEILQPYIDENIVEYCYIEDDDFDRSKVNIQIAAYNDAIIKHRYDTKYMMFIDIDEFVLPYFHKVRSREIDLRNLSVINFISSGVS